MRAVAQRVLLLPIVLAGVVSGPLTGPAMGAETFDGTFGALAAADAVRVTMKVPHAPASDTVLDAGGPSAQAVLDSVGTSQAYASFPYPGENAVTAPALIAGASGGAINLPAYPFYVNSAYPLVPAAEAGGGPYSIKAESDETSSIGTASVGLAIEGQGAIGHAKSVASTISSAEAVTAEGTTEVTSFAIGPLQFGQVLSHAKAILGKDGSLTREADTQVVGASVGDTPVALTSEGLVVAGSPQAIDVAPIQDVLEQAKITVELMPKQEADSGVVAPAVRVTQRDDAGSSITYVLGGVAVFAQGAGTPEDVVEGTGDDEYTESTDSGPIAQDASSETSDSTPAWEATPLAFGASDDLHSAAASSDFSAPASFAVPEFGEFATSGPDVGTQTSAAVPSPSDAPYGGSSSSAAAPVAVQSGVPGAADERGQFASRRLLLSASNSAPLFWVLSLGLIASLAVAVGMRRFGSRV